jgi:hypothetical protein
MSTVSNIKTLCCYVPVDSSGLLTSLSGAVVASQYWTVPVMGFRIFKCQVIVLKMAAPSSTTMRAKSYSSDEYVFTPKY